MAGQGVRLLQDFHGAFASISKQLSDGIAQPVIPLSLITLLGTEGVHILKKHLEESTKAHFTLTVNAALNLVTLTPTGSMTSDSSPEAVASPSADPKKGAAKISRPPNSFIIYRKEWHPRIVQENPNLHNNDISVIIGNKWKAESEAVKAHYKEKAEEAKRQHALDNPGYQYQPRKPSEKKKRMTKNKLAKLAARSQVHTGGFATPQQSLPADFDPLALLDESLALVASNTSIDVSTFGTTWTAKAPTLRNQAAGDIAFDAGDDIELLFAKELEEWNSQHPNLPSHYSESAPMSLSPVNPAQANSTNVDPAQEHIRIGHPITNGKVTIHNGQHLGAGYMLPGLDLSEESGLLKPQSPDSIFKAFLDFPEASTRDATIEIDRQFNLEDDFAALFDYDAAVGETSTNNFS